MSLRQYQQTGQMNQDRIAYWDNQETRINVVVAASENGILLPCDRCREMMVHVDTWNPDCRVVVREGETVSLRAVLQHYWLIKPA